MSSDLLTTTSSHETYVTWRRRESCNVVVRVGLQFVCLLIVEDS